MAAAVYAPPNNSNYRRAPKHSIVTCEDSSIVGVIRCEGKFKCAQTINCNADCMAAVIWGPQKGPELIKKCYDKGLFGASFVVWCLSALFGILAFTGTLPVEYSVLSLGLLFQPAIYFLTYNKHVLGIMKTNFEFLFVTLMNIAFFVGISHSVSYDIRCLWLFVLFISNLITLMGDATHILVRSKRKALYASHLMVAIVTICLGFSANGIKGFRREVLVVNYSELTKISFDFAAFGTQSFLTASIFFFRYLVVLLQDDRKFVLIRARLSMSLITIGQLKLVLDDAPHPDALPVFGTPYQAAKVVNRSDRLSMKSTGHEMPEAPDGRVHPTNDGSIESNVSGKSVKRKKSRVDDRLESKRREDLLLRRAVSVSHLQEEEKITILSVGDNFRDIHLTDVQDTMFAMVFGIKANNTFFSIARKFKLTLIALFFFGLGIIAIILILWTSAGPKWGYMILPAFLYCFLSLSFSNRYIWMSMFKSFEVPYLAIIMCFWTVCFMDVLGWDERIIMCILLCVAFTITLTGDAYHPSAKPFISFGFIISVALLGVMISLCTLGYCVNVKTNTVNIAVSDAWIAKIETYGFGTRNILTVLIFLLRYLKSSLDKDTKSCFAVLKSHIVMQELTVAEIKAYLDLRPRYHNVPFFGLSKKDFGDFAEFPPPRIMY